MVTRQLQVERRTRKVRRSNTDVLLLRHATNQQNAVPVSLEAGEGIPCRPNPTATLLVTKCFCECWKFIFFIDSSLNKNIVTATFCWSTSCSTLSSYNSCCQHNCRLMLTTGYDGRTLLITVDNTCDMTMVALRSLTSKSNWRPR